MRRNKVLLGLLTVILLFAGFAVPNERVQAIGQEEEVRYMSLGDSLAAGFYSDLSIRDGFSDFTADYFKEKDRLLSYSKSYAAGLYKTDDVLRDILLRSALQSELEEANLVSISVGANDALSLVGKDLKTGEITIDEKKVKMKMKEIGENYTEILQIIKKQNPDAEIYAMGYYFPYPHLEEKQKPRLIELTKELNNVIASASEEGGATYVDVYSRFGDNATHLLPNKNDVHPNAEGHKVMSEALLDEIIRGMEDMPQPEPQPEQPQPVIINDIKNHSAKKEMQYLADIGLLKADSAGNVYPDKEISRAEVAQMLYGAFPHIQKVPEDPGFKDVPPTHPAYQAIAALTENGAFSKAKTFNPNGSLQRVQMAKIFTIARNLKHTGKPVSFKDVPIGYWGYEYVQAIVGEGLMRGYTNGLFNKNGNTTKAQFAVVLVRAMEMKM